MAKDPTKLALARAGRELVKQLKRDVKNEHYASGKTMRSIDYRVVENEVHIIADKTLAEISYGTKPSNKNPSPMMIQRIIDWMSYKGIRLRSGSGRFVRQTRNSKIQAANAISRSILRNGIQGSDIIDSAYAKVANKIEDHVMMAFKERVKEELRMTTKDLKV